MKKSTSISIMKKLCIKMILFVILFSLFALSGCSQKASKFSEEEHIGRVTERIQERYIDGDDKLRYDDKPTAFDVYPLYNENDELKYFLVEFQPYGFMYVALCDEKPFYVSLFGKSKSMYVLSHYQGEPYWCRYMVDETDSQPYPDGDKIWEIGENGEKIVRKKSPYSIANAIITRKYLLKDNNGIYVPATKDGDRYTNLISMDEVTIIDDIYTKKQAEAFLFFPIDKKYGL